MVVCQNEIRYGATEIFFDILYAERKTMAIAVSPDGTVTVKAPVGTPLAEVEQRVYRRAGWIRRQLDHFQQLGPPTPKKHYVSGETHLYLGKQYRLKIESAATEGVKLIGRYFFIQIKEKATADKAKELLQAWYTEKAKTKFNESFERCWPSFAKLSSVQPCLKIRHMQKRWGSLSKNGLLTLNTDLVRAPRECIDYVITHELCHLQHHNHGTGFYRLLEKTMPDWKKRKQKLELTLL